MRVLLGDVLGAETRREKLREGRLKGSSGAAYFLMLDTRALARFNTIMSKAQPGT